MREQEMKKRKRKGEAVAPVPRAKSSWWQNEKQVLEKWNEMMIVLLTFCLWSHEFCFAQHKKILASVLLNFIFYKNSRSHFAVLSQSISCLCVHGRVVVFRMKLFWFAEICCFFFQFESANFYLTALTLIISTISLKDGLFSGSCCHESRIICTIHVNWSFCKISAGISGLKVGSWAICTSK